ncbi:uncharacterized protein N7443_003401 [Penicillium atrosanguineum]|uniref:uncharacterized protein n=1 Tax=Penicillium atrosanguineum TaxID=1132637 RepID=UPI00239DFE7C|nr:uncharacterized protein N7443_003401 [Penicillium atrosanguineum]KAJ5310940.1 hypothetical protein N7443_003401 [Penicillium atrosanguineum]
MSQNQQSPFSSSIYDSDFDNYIPPNHPFTPNLSESQETLPSLDTDFLRPLLPPAIPPSLTRVGPSRNKAYILYDEMLHSDWRLDSARKTIYPGMRNISLVPRTNFTRSPKALMVLQRLCILKHPNFVRYTKDGKKQRQGTSTMKGYLSSAGCIKASQGQGMNITQFLQPKNTLVTEEFSQEIWEEKLLTFLTVARLPFRLIEHPEFHRLIRIAQSALIVPDIPSAKIIRRRLQFSVQQQQERILRILPEGAKISIALDCWTSPFTQAFMAITGYFIDKDWQYREVLLGFEPLHGTHSGTNLSSVVLDILLQHKIEGRVFAITTDNASNNQTLLSLNELLGYIKACLLNESTETRWIEQRSQSARANTTKHDIANTLFKIRSLAIYMNASP